MAPGPTASTRARPAKFLVARVSITAFEYQPRASLTRRSGAEGFLLSWIRSQFAACWGAGGGPSVPKAAATSRAGGRRPPLWREDVGMLPTVELPMSLRVSRHGLVPPFAMTCAPRATAAAGPGRRDPSSRRSPRTGAAGARAPSRRLAKRADRPTRRARHRPVARGDRRHYQERYGFAVDPHEVVVTTGPRPPLAGLFAGSRPSRPGAR